MNAVQQDSGHGPWLVSLVLVSTLLRLAMQISLPGFLQGDDLETIEEAAAGPLGLDSVAWNIRNLLIARVVVRPFISVAVHVGIDSPHLLSLAGSVPFIILSALNIVLLYHLAVRWANPRVALMAAAIYSLHWVPLVYGTGGFPRPASVSALLVGLLLVERSSTRRSLLLAGLVLSIAFAVRYSEVIYLFPVAWLLVRSGRRAALAWLLCGYAAGVLVCAGIYDWLTWGAPFHSLIEFARFTLIRRESSSAVSEQSWHWYLGRIPQWWPVPALLAIHRIGGRPAGLALPFVLIPLVALSFIHHKEVRYLQAAMPFVSILAATGIDRLRTRRPVACAVLILSIVWGLSGATKITRRSGAALEAGQWLARRDRPCVAVVQPWAFGGRLTFRSRPIVALPVAPQPSDILGLPTGCSVALYLNATAPDTAAALAARGCVRTGVARAGRSRPVALYDCP